MCRFKVPYTLINDNGPQMKGEHIQRFCTSWNITQLPFVVTYPQTNGLTQAINKNVKTTLKKKLKDVKGL